MTDRPVPHPPGSDHNGPFAAFESLPAGTLVSDPRGRILYLNSVAARLLEGIPAGVLSAFLEACARDGEGETEFDIPSRDGSTRYVAASARLATTLTPEPCVVCVVTDVTARAGREHALRRIEGQYHALTDAAEDHIFVITGDDRVEFVNQAAARQLRSTPEQVIGRSRSEIFPPDVGERQARALQHVFQTGAPFYAEGRTVYVGREVWLSTWLAPVRDAHGNVRAVLGLSRDMSDAKRAADALRDSEQQKRVILANVPLILWAADREGVGTFCAGLGLDAIGGTPADVIGRPFDDIALNPFPALRQDLRRALAGDAVQGLAEIGPATFETWTVPLRDERNDIVGATGVVMDVSERRRLEKDLVNAQKMEVIGHLAGGIAHDFNNNLTAIIGYVDLVKADVHDQAMATSLDEVRHAAERAAGLVRRLLAFGRRQMLQPRMISLNAVVESLMPMLQRLIGEPIEVALTLGGDLPAIVADPVEIEQILMNLALNARDAMPRGGRLVVETAAGGAPERVRQGMPPGPHVVLTVRDTGTGMTADVKARVFEPFFTTKAVDKGTGLGLSTVYGLVKQLGGFIDVESNVGVGTVFHVTLPAADGEVAAGVAAPSAAPRAPVSRATVLLVEDEEPVRRFARRALEHHGFAVIDAATPDAAFTLAADGQAFSLLLTDVVMPRLSGPELARRLRERRPDLKVLYMSGYPANLVRRESLDPDMQLLAKPFSAAQLVARVIEMLAAV